MMTCSPSGKRTNEAVMPEMFMSSSAACAAMVRVMVSSRQAMASRTAATKRCLER